jgi:hypothetical protein
MTWFLLVFLPVMPIGVVHDGFLKEIDLSKDVSLPMMPIGVEHRKYRSQLERLATCPCL